MSSFDTRGIRGNDKVRKVFLCASFFIQALIATAVCAANGDRVAGAYVFGHEVRSFQPCGSSKTYWVKPVDPDLGALLRERHGELAAQPYGRIYIVVTGKPTDQRTVGFAQSYAGYFEAAEVLQVAGRIPPECDIR